MTVKCRVKPVWPFSKVLLINKVQNFLHPYLLDSRQTVHFQNAKKTHI